MRVPQRTDQVLRALTHLAQRRWGEPTPAGEIAEALHLPRRVLEQQMSVLAREGIVTCRRGAGGGCALSRPAEEITVRDVLVALEGDVLDVPRVTGSAVSEVWQETRELLGRHLDSVTLADLAARQDRQDSLMGPMYYI